MKHAVNQVTTQKKATMKKLIHKIFFAKQICKRKKIMVPMYLAPLSPKNKKILEITAPPAAKKIYSKIKIALKRTYEKYVTKMKKRISHTQSTTNYCLISSTFQKKFQKNLPL